MRHRTWQRTLLRVSSEVYSARKTSLTGPRHDEPAGYGTHDAIHQVCAGTSLCKRSLVQPFRDATYQHAFQRDKDCAKSIVRAGTERLSWMSVHTLCNTVSACCLDDQEDQPCIEEGCENFAASLGLDYAQLYLHEQSLQTPTQGPLKSRFITMFLVSERISMSGCLLADFLHMR